MVDKWIVDDDGFAQQIEVRARERVAEVNNKACAADAQAAPDLPATFMNDPDFDACLRQCRDILGIKGTDYTIGSTDRLHNFRTVGEFTGLDPKATLGVYFYKHVAAIFAFIKDGQRESEPIEGRICDAINYLLLLSKMIAESKRGT